MLREKRPPWLCFVITTFVTVLALLLTLLLYDYLTSSIFAFLFGAVLFSAWYGGFWFGFWSTFLSVIFSVIFLLPILNSPQEEASIGWVALISFGFVAGLSNVIYQLRANAKQAQQRAELLAEVSNILATSFDNVASFQSVAQLLVPSIADWCSIDIIENGILKRVAVSFRDHLEFEPSQASSSSSSISRPILLQGRILGTISLKMADKNYRYKAADLQFVEELARRTALAVENTNLYKQFQQEYKDKEQSLAILDTLLASTPIGLGFLDKDLRFVSLNDALAVINGGSVEQHIGKSLPEIITRLRNIDIHEIVSDFQHVLETGEPIIERELVTALASEVSRERYWLASYYPVRTKSREMLGIGVVVTEITARKLAENSQQFLSQAADFLSSTLDYDVTLKNVAKLAVPFLADYCIVEIVEEDNKLHQIATVHIDPNKEALIQELQTRHFLAEDDRLSILQILRLRKPEFIPYVEESLIFAQANNERELEIMKELRPISSIRVPLIARQHILGTISFLYSTSGRHYSKIDFEVAEKLAERAALALDNARLYSQAQRSIEAQKELDQLKDHFLSVASHELRTPITSIKGYAQLLQRRFLKYQETGNATLNVKFDRENQVLDSIIYQINRMNDLIGEMLDITRIQNGQLELKYLKDVDLVKLIKAVIDLFQQTVTDHIFEFRSDNEIVCVDCDPTRVEQVLTNLFSNAIKYSSPGTTVTIGLELFPEHQNGTFTPDQVLVWVRDQGYGVPLEQQSHIFESFYRARSSDTSHVDGLGLGLFISHEIVTQHGGRIWVESVQRQGSTFYFSIPINANVVENLKDVKAGVISPAK